MILGLMGALEAGCGKISGAAGLALGQSASPIMGKTEGKIKYGDCCANTAVPSFGVAVDGRMILERSRPLGDGLVPFAATLHSNGPVAYIVSVVLSPL